MPYQTGIQTLWTQNCKRQRYLFNTEVVFRFFKYWFFITWIFYIFFFVAIMISIKSLLGLYLSTFFPFPWEAALCFLYFPFRKYILYIHIDLKHSYSTIHNRLLKKFKCYFSVYFVLNQFYFIEFFPIDAASGLTSLE